MSPLEVGLVIALVALALLQHWRHAGILAILAQEAAALEAQVGGLGAELALLAEETVEEIANIDPQDAYEMFLLQLKSQVLSWGVAWIGEKLKIGDLSIAEMLPPSEEP